MVLGFQKPELGMLIKMTDYWGLIFWKENSMGELQFLEFF